MSRHEKVKETQTKNKFLWNDKNEVTKAFSDERPKSQTQISYLDIICKKKQKNILV